MSQLTHSFPVTAATPPKVHLRVNGERIETGSGGVFDHIYPATGEVNGQIPLAGPAEIRHAVEKAHEAYQGWRATAPAVRRGLLMKLADLLEANAEKFPALFALDNGTPVGSPLSRHPRLAAEWTRYYAGWADKLTGGVSDKPEDSGELGLTLKQPYGVIGIIITWNGPLLSLAMKIPPAVAAGNTVVVKPSELTPFTGELFMDLVEEAGFPPGVINVLPGNAEAGAELVSHPLVKKITFTGGPDTATKILEACAPTMKPAVLELGGKSANIVFDDVDIDAACAFGAHLSIVRLSGQGCSFATRMVVQDTIYDQVVAGVKSIAEKVSVGDPFDPTVESGPVVNEAAVQRILGMIERAKADGATVVAGGKRIDRPGFFVEPTVLVDVDPQSEIAQKEVFGPVLCIFRFHTEEEAVALANATDYALAAYVQTKDLTRAIRVASQLDAGDTMINGAKNVMPNRPFGGFGLSGVGKEGGREGIEEFLRTRNVSVAI